VLNVIMLNVIMLSVTIMIFIMLTVIMLTVIMLIVIMLTVMTFGPCLLLLNIESGQQETMFMAEKCSCVYQSAQG
jgi:hypothetical protein